jgi:CheY-like chemotaxis protein/anti-sigma regulatory factor (Ser/Thr protein kinase)
MPTVLIVDDSAMDRRLAGGLLERNENWVIKYASNAEEAIASFSEEKPDIVLTDLQMPDMNGLELLDAIRELSDLTPVVLMTARGNEETAVSALEQGAASYVPKSRLAMDLEETLGKVLAVSGEVKSQSLLMEHLTHHGVEFSLINDPKLIPAAVHYLQKVASYMDFYEQAQRLRIGVALEEALLNAYFHGNLEVSSKLREQDHAEFYELAEKRRFEAPYRSRRIIVKASINSEKAEYIIEDQGPGFDIQEIPDATEESNLERPCGRGILLIRTFMDEVSFNDKGNQITMIKYKVSSHKEDE